ncbi:MAG: hypothetical protein NTV49_02055 [Kiritimatiellaeota bacterium]|nr:hypothetical protein [Kiritimatiellota bacterium]
MKHEQAALRGEIMPVHGQCRMLAGLLGGLFCSGAPIEHLDEEGRPCGYVQRVDPRPHGGHSSGSTSHTHWIDFRHVSEATGRSSGAVVNILLGVWGGLLVGAAKVI